jgi:hypothetical protein
MFLSSLAVGYFIMSYLEMRLFVSSDALFIAVGLLAASFVAIRFPIVGGVLGVLIALYPLIASLQEIEVYYIYYYIIATSILMIASSLIVVRSRIIR